MAQLPKVYAPTPAQTVAASRGLPVSRVASLNGNIEESTSTFPSALDDALPFTLHDEQLRNEVNQHPTHQNAPRHGGRVVVPSREFTSLMEYPTGAGANDDDPEVRARHIGGIVNKAIKTYETNAKVIHGEADVTGTEISLRL